MSSHIASVVVLAAGQGKRMKSELPKVLHPVCGFPMLLHVLNAAEALEAKRRLVILGHGHEQVE
ncbi:MAG: NTP transferase domain-containing protein, partial [Thermoleophilia bacterium]|nr:NTP transferase domain-containing protein [Thermoleophilia bacterium]